MFEKTLTAVGTVRPYAAAVRDRSMTETSGEQRRAMRHPPPPVPSPSGLVGLDDRLRNAPAVARLVPVLPGPPADRVSLLAVRPSGCAGHRRLPSGAACPLERPSTSRRSQPMPRRSPSALLRNST